jgi:hypothetical protein
MKGRGLKLFCKLTTEEDVGYVRINRVKSYSPHEESVATSDNTFVDQEDDYVDHVAGMIDPGETSFSVEYDRADAGQIKIESMLAQQLDFKVQWKDGSGETYRGTLIKRGLGEPNDEHLLRNYGVKLSGASTPFDAV